MSEPSGAIEGDQAEAPLSVVHCLATGQQCGLCLAQHGSGCLLARRARLRSVGCPSADVLSIPSELDGSELAERSLEGERRDGANGSLYELNWQKHEWAALTGEQQPSPPWRPN